MRDDPMPIPVIWKTVEELRAMERSCVDCGKEAPLNQDRVCSVCAELRIQDTETYLRERDGNG